MKITPKVNKGHKTVDYTSLEDGNCFIHAGELCIKEGGVDQTAFALDGSGHYDNMCGKQVIPVDAVLKWSYKKPAKKAVKPKKPKINRRR